MNGRNLFESRATKILGAKFAGTHPRPGVFISHSRLDKEKARDVARALAGSKVDYYFDEKDEELRLADEQNADLKVVRCIEMESKCALICLESSLRTRRTPGGVPYEIGSATGRGRGCAHLIDREVNRLPSYIRAARVLTSRADLREWLASDVRKASSAIVELAQRLAAALDYPDFILADRSLQDLAFY
jgi:hypothetical protein